MNKATWRPNMKSHGKVALILATSLSLGGLAAVAIAGVAETTPASNVNAKQFLLDREAQQRAHHGTLPILSHPIDVGPGEAVRLMGIIPSGQAPWKDRFDFVTTWGGPSTLVYSGSLHQDMTQGVVVVATREALPKVENIYLTNDHDGLLRMTSAPGNGLQLIAANGRMYTFDLGSHSLQAH